MIFDTHTHIYLPEFDEDCQLVVQRAKESGVVMLMLPNVDVEYIKKILSDLDLKDLPEVQNLFK